MSLEDQAHKRLEDLVELQPTKNKELQDRWGLDSGSEVHTYLESELSDYYYRDDDSLIRATPKAVRLVGGTSQAITISPLQADIIDRLAHPDEEPMSVVATLHALQDTGVETDVDSVRSALRGLVDRGVAEIVRRTVPTYRLTAIPSDLDITIRDDTQGTSPSEDTDHDDEFDRREDPTPSRRGG